MSKSVWGQPIEFKGKWHVWQRPCNSLVTELGQKLRAPHAKLELLCDTFTCPLKLLGCTVQFLSHTSPSGNRLYSDKYGAPRMIRRLCLRLVLSPSGFSTVPEPWHPFPSRDWPEAANSASELCPPPCHKWCTKGSNPSPEQWTCPSAHRRVDRESCNAF